MMRLWRFLTTHKVALLGGTVFWICMAFVFAPVLPQYAALVSADSGPFFPYAYRTKIIEGFLTGTAFSPQQLYWLLFPPLYAHELTYMIDSFVLALGGVYYLRGRRVHPLAAWAGGIALGLSGYTFTLFSAGHRGYFHMFSCAVWSFGLLLRCFETRQLFYFAMLGLVFAWGVSYQPDVMILVGALAAAYALWLTLKGCGTGGRWCATAGRRIVSVWPRFALAILVLALVGFNGIKAAVTTQIASRDAQIAGSSPAVDVAAKKTGVKSDAERHNRWIFATNWSLPPEDMLEFIVPGVFGNESMQPPYPYWGRLGRPADEVFQKGRMMPNYRQHTVHLGVIPVSLALFAVIGWLSLRKKKDEEQKVGDGADYSDIPFWCAVWVVCLILAMGRYTPVYRLFYAIPYMDYIRAPVKFHHLVEVATAFLAGFGLNFFLRTESVPLRRKWIGASVVLLVLLVASVLVAVVSKPQLVKHITELGLGAVAPALGDYTIQNFIRSIILVFFVGLVSWGALKWGGWVRTALGGVLFLALAFDHAAVASRFVRVLNVEPLCYPNMVVQTIQKEARSTVANVVNYVTSNRGVQDWFSESLGENGLCNLTPDPGGDPHEPLPRLFSTLARDPHRLWQVCQVQYVVVPRKSCEPFLRAGVLRDVADMTLGAGTVHHTTTVDDNTVTLARVCEIKGGPHLVLDWKGGIPFDQQVDALGGTALDVSDAPPPARSSAEHAPIRDDARQTVRIQTLRGSPGVFSTRLEVGAGQNALLIFDEKKKNGMEVFVDGGQTKLFTANAIWPAILVSPGNHQVVLRLARHRLPILISGLCSLCVVGWGLLPGRRRRLYVGK